MRSRSRGWIER
jgi:hypothetical protein